MSCPYCDDPDRYGLLPRELCEYGEDARGAQYYSTLCNPQLTGTLHWGHKDKNPSLDYPNYNIECYDRDTDSPPNDNRKEMLTPGV